MKLPKQSHGVHRPLAPQVASGAGGVQPSFLGALAGIASAVLPGVIRAIAG